MCLGCIDLRTRQYPHLRNAPSEREGQGCAHRVARVLRVRGVQAQVRGAVLRVAKCACKVCECEVR